MATYVEKKIVSIFNKYLELWDEDDQSLNKTANFIETYYVDSLDFLVIVNDIEDEFNIHIPQDNLMKMNSIQDFIDFVESLQ